MADTKTDQSKLDLINIDSQAFLRFAKARKIDFKCSHCSEGQFTLVTTEADRAVALIDISRTNPDLEDMRSLEQMVVECDNCGHSEFFRRNTIARWLSENP